MGNSVVVAGLRQHSLLSAWHPFEGFGLFDYVLRHKFQLRCSLVLAIRFAPLVRTGEKKQGKLVEFMPRPH